MSLTPDQVQALGAATARDRLRAWAAQGASALPPGIQRVRPTYNPPAPSAPADVCAFVVDGWALHPVVTGEAADGFQHATSWTATNVASGNGTGALSFDVASALWAAFVEQAPNLDTSNMSAAEKAKINGLWAEKADQTTHQKRAAGKRMPPKEVDRILSAHFNAHPDHWTNGRGGKTAVSAVAAITGLPVSTISEWAADATKAKADAGDAYFSALPVSPTLPNQENTVPANSIPNDPAAEILPDQNTAPVGSDLESLAKGLAGIQNRLQDATKQVAAANAAKAKAEAAAQRVNETNKELSDKLKEAETALQSVIASKGSAAPAIRTAQEDDNSHIPTVDATHICDAIDQEIEWSLKHGSDILITGPTGCGKTAPAIQACARSKRPMRRVCFDGETTSQDLIGRRDAVNGATVWTDGILPQAMEAGQVLLVDEIDRADESARAALFSVLDSRSMYLPVPNKRIMAAAGFQLIAACNGVGDTSGAYTGTQPIDAAFLGRWLDVVRVEYPTPAREAKMLVAAVPGLHPSFADKTCEFFAVLRKAEADGNLTGPFSIRQSKRLAQLYFMFKCEGLDMKRANARAAIRTLIDRTTEDNRVVIRETFQRVYGFECSATVAPGAAK